MTFPIGTNAQAYSPDLDWGKTLDWWEPFNSSVHVVTINNMNDKGRIFEAQRRWKNSLIVARFVVTVKDQNGKDIELDGALHTKPQGPGDNNYWLVSPTNYMNLIEPMAEKDAILYWMNEPSGEVDPITFDRLVKHNVEGIAIADDRKHSLCIINWGVGHPLIINGKADRRLVPIIKAISNARMRHYWGMHLYAPTDTYKAIEALEALCIDERIEMPPVIVTEWGFDTGFPGDPLNGYKTRPGIDGRQLGNFGVDAVKNKLRRFIETRKLIGIVGFCEGGSPKQEAFNYANDQGYKDRLKEALQIGEINLTIKTQTGTFPKYYPGIKPVAADYPHLYKVGLPKGMDYRNLRVLPDDASDKASEIHDAELVRVYDTPTITDNLMRKWQWCEVVEGMFVGQTGWLFIGGISLIPALPANAPSNTQEVKAVVVPTNAENAQVASPTPDPAPTVATVATVEPPPPPAPKTRDQLIVEQLKIIRGAIDALIQICEPVLVST